MIITRPSYQNFHYNGTNFRQSIQDPDSRLRKLIEYVHNSKTGIGRITKHNFYWTIQPNRAFVRPPNTSDHDFLSRKLKKGWNQTFWSSVQKAGVIKRNVQKKKDLHGRWWYDKGDRWDWWLTTYLFFTKDDTVTRWVYNEDDIPDGWTVKPTSIKDDFGTLKDWAQKCDRLIDRGIPTPSIHSPIFDTFASDTFASYDDSSDGSTTDDDQRPRPSLPDRVEGASIIERRSGDRANRYGHNW